MIIKFDKYINESTGNGEFDHYWYWKAKLPERNGKKIKVVKRGGRMNTVVVEFEEDGYKVSTSRHAIRKITPKTLKFVKE